MNPRPSATTAHTPIRTQLDRVHHGHIPRAAPRTRKRLLGAGLRARDPREGAAGVGGAVGVEVRAGGDGGRGFGAGR